MKSKPKTRAKDKPSGLVKLKQCHCKWCGQVLPVE